MKGNLRNLLGLKGLENKNAGNFFLTAPSVNPGSKNHFFAVGQEEQSPEQAGAEEASFFGMSFLAASL